MMIPARLENLGLSPIPTAFSAVAADLEATNVALESIWAREDAGLVDAGVAAVENLVLSERLWILVPLRDNMLRARRIDLRARLSRGAK